MAPVTPVHRSGIVSIAPVSPIVDQSSRWVVAFGNGLACAARTGKQAEGHHCGSQDSAGQGSWMHME